MRSEVRRRVEEVGLCSVRATADNLKRRALLLPKPPRMRILKKTRNWRMFMPAAPTLARRPFRLGPEAVRGVA
jgi:hypothetical protein